VNQGHQMKIFFQNTLSCIRSNIYVIIHISSLLVNLEIFAMCGLICMKNPKIYCQKNASLVIVLLS
jgi:hypothetical protein